MESSSAVAGKESVAMAANRSRGRMGGEDAPLPPNLKRRRKKDSEVMATDSDSEEAVWDPMALQRWHDKRQKVESSAVAGKESSAMAGNGGMIVVALREEENEELSSQATTLQLGSPAKNATFALGVLRGRTWTANARGQSRRLTM